MSILKESPDRPVALAGCRARCSSTATSSAACWVPGGMGAVLAVGLAACVGEAPVLPEMTGLAEGSTNTDASGASSTGVTGLSSTGSGGPAAECGNGEREQGEECDGTDWQGTACESLGFLGGGLACGEDCAFDTSGCHSCGNGAVDSGEECDEADLDGQSCESLGHVPGVLGCTGSCTYDIGGCAPPGMVVVPGGVFEMGSNEGSDEQPIRPVQVDTFYVDQTEVTVASYEACVTDGACTEPGTGGSCNWMVAGREGHPVNCVDWYEAEAYCGWAGGGTKRLPTEAEWEKAARGTDARKYPWGNTPEPSCSHVVMDDAAAGGDGCGNGSTMEVGSKPLGASPYGVQDMAGNVWEWVSDWYGSSYDAAESDNPTGPAKGTSRVSRSGSWDDFNAFYFRAAYRNYSNPASTSRSVGLRCARTPPGAQ